MSLGTLGKYERLSVLGRGVSGIVYLAKDTLLNRQIALKEVDVQAGDLRRFLEEARVMDRLRHPNIVRVNGIDRIEDKVVIDMEYVRGRNLQETLRAEGPLNIPRSLDIGIQILDALEYAHSMQTVHRDIKPANILLGKDGVVKLADFGLAEILATNAYACGAGTYAYMAPEDFEEENHSDSQSDIWAVSVTMFEMMTGERPFEVTNPKSPFAWKRALESQEPQLLRSFLPEATEALEAIISRGLARDKDVRFLTAGEFHSELKEVRAALPSAAMSPVDYASIAYGASPVTVLEPAGIHTQETLADNVGARNRVRNQEPLQDRAPKRTEPFIPAEMETVASTPKQLALAEPLERKHRRSFLRFKAREARLVVSPDSIDFGTVRRGESRQAKLSTRISNLVGESGGRIFSDSDWISIEPKIFDTARQAIFVTALTDRASAPGVSEGSVCVESRAGAVTVPIRVNVLKPRLTFLQIAHWFVPLFGVALAPALVTAMLGADHPVLAAPAALSSLALGLMLLLIASAADTGIAERLACGVLMVLMCFVLGLAVAASGQKEFGEAYSRGVKIATETGTGLGMIVIGQLLTAKRWKFWGVILMFLGILLTGICYHVAVG